MHKVRVSDLTANDGKVFLDDLELQGVRSVHIHNPFGEATTITIELVVEVVNPSGADRPVEGAPDHA